MASLWKRAKDKSRPGSKRYITYAAAPGVYKKLVGLTDYRLTEQLAGRLEADALLRHRGLIDPVAERWAERGKAPIDAHVIAYETYLESKRNTEQHVRETKALIEDSITECRWETIADIDGARFSDLLKRDVAGGLAPRTANKRRLAVRGFTRWLAREARLRADPLAGVAAIRERDDIRCRRRAMEDAESVRLLAAAEAGPVHSGLTGPDRAMLYRVALNTGFRAGELFSLSRGAFNLEARIVTLQARSSKRRREDVQPIPADLCAVLRPWLAQRDRAARLWRTTNRDTSRMIHADLKAAEIDAADTGEGLLDFHALRHTYITRLGRAGIAPKVMQTLARHSTITLTLDRYNHLALNDPAAAIDSLPALGAADVALAATGTDDAVPAEHKLEHKSGAKPEHGPAQAGTPLRIGLNSGSEAQTLAVASVVTSGRDRAKLSAHPAGCQSGLMGRIANPSTNPSVSAEKPDILYTQAQDGAQVGRQIDSPEAPADPELQVIVRAWEHLPSAVRVGIVAMVKATGGDW